MLAERVHLGARPTSLPRKRSDPARWLRDALRAQILDGVYGVRPLPSEQELSVQFRVSRNVVRNALDLLRQDGLVRRTPGSGTFVSGTMNSQSLDRLRGLAESIQGNSEHLVNQVLTAEIVPASALVAERLEVEVDAPVVFIERLRSLPEGPVALDASYLPAGIAGALLEPEPGVSSRLGSCDVFDLLENPLGLELGGASLSIEAITADPATALFLEVAPGSPLLLIHRLTWLLDGRPVDFEFVRYRGDRMSFTAWLDRHPDGGTT